MPEYNPVAEKIDPPWEAIAADRAQCPVAHVSLPEQEFFQITSYELITEVLRNHKVFSNIHGTTVTVESYSDEEQILSFADPPRHTQQRRLMVSAFSPARVDAIGPHIQEVADDCIDRLDPDGGTFELTETIAAALPVQIICEMLGVPLDDRDEFIIDRDFDNLPSHLGFGMGIHHCLGSNLARMEASVAIETLYRRVPNLRFADGFTPSSTRARSSGPTASSSSPTTGRCSRGPRDTGGRAGAQAFEPTGRSVSAAASIQGPTPLTRSIDTRTTTESGESRRASGWRPRPRYFLASRSISTGSGPSSMRARPRTTRCRWNPRSLRSTSSIDSIRRSSRRRFRAFTLPAAVPKRISSSWAITQTTETCGDPSGLLVQT